MRIYLHLQPQNKFMAKKNETESAMTEAYKRLKIVVHPLRKKIMAAISTAQDGEITVGDLYKKLDLEQSVCSQQLALLRKANAVDTRREGKFIYYSVNKSVINQYTILSEEIVSL